jgi:glycosyltransferase involved in cell wall biosynthesis
MKVKGTATSFAGSDLDGSTTAEIERPPLLSLGLPVYNGQRYLEETLECIASQTFEDFELIIADNGSTDRTEEICRAYAASDPRIRYVRSETNLGAAPNYNRAFTLSSGKYFKWVADDDLYAKEFLERCVEALEADPEIVLACSAAVDIDEDGNLLCEIDSDLHVDAAYPHERFRYLSCINHACLQVFGVIRADVLRRTPLIASYVGSDRVLLAELALHGRFVELPERLFLHREHPNRSTRAIPDLRSRAAWFDTRAKKRQHFPTSRLFGEYLAAIGRSPLAVADRVRCSYQLLRWWKHNGIAVWEEVRTALWAAGTETRSSTHRC